MGVSVFCSNENKMMKKEKKKWTLFLEDGALRCIASASAPCSKNKKGRRSLLGQV
jgi:hypothetical protein